MSSRVCKLQPKVHKNLAQRRALVGPTCSLFGWPMPGNNRSNSANTSSSSDMGFSNGTPVSQLQQLFEFSRATFRQYRGSSMPAETVACMHQHLAMVPLAEMGLDAPPEADPPCNMAQVQERIRSFEAAQQKQPPITYLHLFEDQEMSMGIFCLPAGATIPLHDHPGMTVFSRVLYGQLFIQAFDWVSAHAPSSPSHGGSHSAASSGTGTDEDASCVDESRPAKLVVARVQGINDPPAVLFPRHSGNIHTFTALTDCAVLDVLSPPYNSKSGRDCTYYYITAHDPAKPGLFSLAEYDPPDDFQVKRGEYKGLKIKVNPEDAGQACSISQLTNMADQWRV